MRSNNLTEFSAPLFSRLIVSFPFSTNDSENNCSLIRSLCYLSKNDLSSLLYFYAFEERKSEFVFLLCHKKRYNA